jgi:hypothetical protein
VRAWEVVFDDAGKGSIFEKTPESRDFANVIAKKALFLRIGSEKLNKIYVFVKKQTAKTEYLL